MKINVIKYGHIIYHWNASFTLTWKYKNLYLKIHVWDWFTTLLILFASHICLHGLKNKTSRCSGKLLFCGSFKKELVWSYKNIFYCKCVITVTNYSEEVKNTWKYVQRRSFSYIFRRIYRNIPTNWSLHWHFSNILPSRTLIFQISSGWLLSKLVMQHIWRNF